MDALASRILQQMHAESSIKAISNEFDCITRLGVAKANGRRCQE